jgi:hypothetical protein
MWSGGHRGGGAHAGRVWLAVLCATLLCAAPAGAATVNAPGFVAGPRITPAGLLWLTSSRSMLTHAGVSAPVAGHGAFTITSSTSGWQAIATSAGVRAGRLGVSLKRLTPFRGCPPLLYAGAHTRLVGSRLLALTGSMLFAIVDPRCLHRRGYGRAAIFSENLASGSWKLLAAAPKDALTLSASGGRLAIAAGVFGQETLERLVVGVYRARNGRLLYRAAAHLTAGLIGGGTRLLSLATSVDGLGDVLVTETEHTPPPGGARGFGWWATPASPSEHPLPDLLTTEVGLPEASGREYQPRTVDAALSAGRVAYATSASAATEIDLRDLRTHRSRTLVRFPGEVKVLGLDLGAGELAWAQQSQVLVAGHTEITPNEGQVSACNVVPLGQPQLVSADLGSIPASGLIDGGPPPAVHFICAPKV